MGKHSKLDDELHDLRSIRDAALQADTGDPVVDALRACRHHAGMGQVGPVKVLDTSVIEGMIQV